MVVPIDRLDSKKGLSPRDSDGPIQRARADSIIRVLFIFAENFLYANKQIFEQWWSSLQPVWCMPAVVTPKKKTSVLINTSTNLDLILADSYKLQSRSRTDTNPTRIRYKRKEKYAIYT